MISADAVVWLLEHVEGVNTEKQAVQASKPSSQGYFLYFGQ